MTNETRKKTGRPRKISVDEHVKNIDRYLKGIKNEEKK